jgi:hypothetical protein
MVRPEVRRARPAGRMVCPAGQVARPAGRVVSFRSSPVRPTGRTSCPAGQVIRPAGQKGCSRNHPSRPAGQIVGPAGRTFHSASWTTRKRCALYRIRLPLLESSAAIGSSSARSTRPAAAGFWKSARAAPAYHQESELPLLSRNSVHAAGPSYALLENRSDTLMLSAKLRARWPVEILIRQSELR